MIVREVDGDDLHLTTDAGGVLRARLVDRVDGEGLIVPYVVGEILRFEAAAPEVARALVAEITSRVSRRGAEALEFTVAAEREAELATLGFQPGRYILCREE